MLIQKNAVNLGVKTRWFRRIPRINWTQTLTKRFEIENIIEIEHLSPCKSYKIHLFILTKTYPNLIKKVILIRLIPKLGILHK